MKCEISEICGDQSLFEASNYFSDEDFAKQVVLHEILNRKLLKYAYDNEAEDCEWDDDREHHYISMGALTKTLYIGTDIRCKCNKIYFSKREIAYSAIEDVVKPFMAKHPEFVW